MLRVGLNWMVRSRISSKLSKNSGSVDELRDRRGLLAVHARRHVDEHQLTNEIGRAVGERERREPAERHPDDGARVGRELAHRLLERGRVLRGPVRVVVAVRGMPVAGKVDGDERTVEREGNGVPGVGVLRAAVYEHQLGAAPAPRERTDRSAGGLHLDAPHGRRSGPWDSEFLRVLVEERELVVRRGFGHER